MKALVHLAFGDMRKALNIMQVDRIEANMHLPIQYTQVTQRTCIYTYF